LFVKVVIADRLSIYVDIVYNSPEHHSAISSLVATLFFTFQIYCDFSGYSSIAIGCAKVLGIDLMINFRRPYMSTSIREFWSRWHISLSTWFRDYLYILLGLGRIAWFLFDNGNRVRSIGTIHKTTTFNSLDLEFCVGGHSLGILPGFEFSNR